MNEIMMKKSLLFLDELDRLVFSGELDPREGCKRLKEHIREMKKRGLIK